MERLEKEATSRVNKTDPRCEQWQYLYVLDGERLQHVRASITVLQTLQSIQCTFAGKGRYSNGGKRPQ